MSIIDIEIKGPQDIALDLPQERITGDILRGRGPRRGNLEALLRYWRPIMKKPGGFRRCVVILADKPKFGGKPQRICAWLHHETTGKWPNEGGGRGGRSGGNRRGRSVSRTVRRAGRRAAKAEYTDDVEVAAWRLARREHRESGGILAQPISGQNSIEYKASLYMKYQRSVPAPGEVRDVIVPEMAAKGLWGMETKITGEQVVHSAVSYVLPGDLSDIRHPIRSTIYETLTPGGNSRNGRGVGGAGLPGIRGRNGRGRARNRYRCPPGFEGGGRFTNSAFSTCGRQILAIPRKGPGSFTSAGRREIDLLARRADLATPIGDIRKNRNAFDIVRAAQIPVAPKAVNENAIRRSVFIVTDGLDQEDFGDRVVRRDGVILERSVPKSTIGGLGEFDDMNDGIYVVSSVNRDNQIGREEVPTMGTGVRAIAFHEPKLGTLRLNRVGGDLKDEERSALPRLWADALRATDDEAGEADPTAALRYFANKSKGRYEVNFYTPKGKPLEEDDNEQVRIKRGNVVRTVPKWVYALYLGPEAPRRIRGQSPWVLDASPTEKGLNVLVVDRYREAGNARRIASKQNMVEFRAGAFRDSHHILQTEVKRGVVSRARAIPDGNGRFRCPPGTRHGGRFTDRFGRGCGYSLPRTIVNKLVDLGVRLEEFDDRRRARRAPKLEARRKRRAERNKEYRQKVGGAIIRLGEVVGGLEAAIKRADTGEEAGRIGATIGQSQRRAGQVTPEDEVQLGGQPLANALDSLADLVDAPEFEDVDVDEARKVHKAVSSAANAEAGRNTVNPPNTREKGRIRDFIANLIDRIADRIDAPLRRYDTPDSENERNTDSGPGKISGAIAGVIDGIAGAVDSPKYKSKKNRVRRDGVDVPEVRDLNDDKRERLDVASRAEFDDLTNYWQDRLGKESISYDEIDSYINRLEDNGGRQERIAYMRRSRDDWAELLELQSDDEVDWEDRIGRLTDARREGILRAADFDGTHRRDLARRQERSQRRQGDTDVDTTVLPPTQDEAQEFLDDDEGIDLDALPTPDADADSNLENIEDIDTVDDVDVPNEADVIDLPDSAVEDLNELDSVVEEQNLVPEPVLEQIALDPEFEAILAEEAAFEESLANVAQQDKPELENWVVAHEDELQASFNTPEQARNWFDSTNADLEVHGDDLLLPEDIIAFRYQADGDDEPRVRIYRNQGFETGAENYPEGVEEIDLFADAPETDAPAAAENAPAGVDLSTETHNWLNVPENEAEVFGHVNLNADDAEALLRKNYLAVKKSYPELEFGVYNDPGSNRNYIINESADLTLPGHWTPVDTTELDSEFDGTKFLDSVQDSGGYVAGGGNIHSLYEALLDHANDGGNIDNDGLEIYQDAQGNYHAIGTYENFEPVPTSWDLVGTGVGDESIEVAADDWIDFAEDVGSNLGVEVYAGEVSLEQAEQMVADQGKFQTPEFYLDDGGQLHALDHEWDTYMPNYIGLPEDWVYQEDIDPVDHSGKKFEADLVEKWNDANHLKAPAGDVHGLPANTFDKMVEDHDNGLINHPMMNGETQTIVFRNMNDGMVYAFDQDKLPEGWADEPMPPSWTWHNSFDKVDTPPVDSVATDAPNPDSPATGGTVLETTAKTFAEESPVYSPISLRETVDMHADTAWGEIDTTKSTSYGAIIMNDEGQVLLRKPTNHYDGYHWTFAKGTPDADPNTGELEHPWYTASRELGEETGWSMTTQGILPGGFSSGNSTTHFFVGKAFAHDPEKMDWETSETKWVNLDEALSMVSESTNEAGRKRDQNIVSALMQMETDYKNGQTASYEVPAELYGTQPSEVGSATPTKPETPAEIEDKINSLDDIPFEDITTARADIFNGFPKKSKFDPGGNQKALLTDQLVTQYKKDRVNGFTHQEALERIDERRDRFRKSDQFSGKSDNYLDRYNWLPLDDDEDDIKGDIDGASGPNGETSEDFRNNPDFDKYHLGDYGTAGEAAQDLAEDNDSIALYFDPDNQNYVAMVPDWVESTKLGGHMPHNWMYSSEPDFPIVPEDYSPPTVGKNSYGNESWNHPPIGSSWAAGDAEAYWDARFSTANTKISGTQSSFDGWVTEKENLIESKAAQLNSGNFDDAAYAMNYEKLQTQIAVLEGAKAARAQEFSDDFYGAVNTAADAGDHETLTTLAAQYNASAVEAEDKLKHARELAKNAPDSPSRAKALEEVAKYWGEARNERLRETQANAKVSGLLEEQKKGAEILKGNSTTSNIKTTDPMQHLELPRPDGNIGYSTDDVGKLADDKLETAVAHLADGGGLSSIPDKHIRQAIVANMGDGKRYKPLSKAWGINDDAGEDFKNLLVEDTLDPLNRKYMIKSPTRDDREYLNEQMAQEVFRAVGLPSSSIKSFGDTYNHNSTAANAPADGITTNKSIIAEHVDNLLDGATVPSGGEDLDLEHLGKLIYADYLIGEFDRHGDNRIERVGANGQKIYMPIDHGKSFNKWDPKFGEDPKLYGALSKIAQKKGLDDKQKRKLAGAVKRAHKKASATSWQGVGGRIWEDNDYDGAEQKRLMEHAQYIGNKLDGFDEAYEEFAAAMEIPDFTSKKQLPVGTLQTPAEAYDKYKAVKASLFSEYVPGSGRVKDLSVRVGEIKLKKDGDSSGKQAVQALYYMRDSDIEDWASKVDSGEITGWTKTHGIKTQRGQTFTDDPSFGSSNSGSGGKTDYYLDKNISHPASGPGDTYRKELDDGTVLYVYHRPGDAHSQHGQVRVMHQHSNTAGRREWLSSEFETALEDAGIPSITGTLSEEELGQYAQAKLVQSLGRHDGAELEEKLDFLDERLGITTEDVELVPNSWGGVDARLTDDAAELLYDHINDGAEGPSSFSAHHSLSSNVEDVLSSGILMGGNRWFHGNSIKGASTETDIGNGSGNHAYMHWNHSGEAVNGYLVPAGGRDGMKKILGKLGWHAHTGDNWGVPWAASDNIEILRKGGKKATGSLTGTSGELMVPLGLEIGTEMVYKVGSAYKREQILENLRKAKIKAINGIPIEDVVILKEDYQW